MRKISSLIVATALLLAAGIGGWTVLATSNVAAKATHSDSFSGPTHIGAGAWQVLECELERRQAINPVQRPRHERAHFLGRGVPGFRRGGGTTSP